MVRVACVATAIVIAVVVGRVGTAAGELKGARAPAWFWTFPAPSPSRQKEKRGPEWFWSFRATDLAEARRAAARTLIFSGNDLWRQGAFLYGGMLWAPQGFDNDGFVVKAITTRGNYRYRSSTLGNITVTGAMFATSVMPGARFTRGGVTMTIFAGFDYQMHALSPDDPGAALRGRHTGLRVAGDLWYQPTPATILTAAGTLSTIGNTYAVGSTFGWRVFDQFYLGPEVSAYGAGDYWQARAGVHVTGLEFIRLDWQGAIGYALDDGGESGVYMRLGVLDRW